MTTKRIVGIARGQGAAAVPVSYLRTVAPAGVGVVVDIAPSLPMQRVSRGAALGSPWSGPDFCLLEGIDQDVAAQVERLLTNRMRLRRGDVLYRVGGRFSALYAIRTGTCKTVMLAKNGLEQVAGLYITGEIIGLDGIDTDIHECQATALEDTEVCPLPFHEIERLAQRNARLQHNLLRMLMHRYARARRLMLVLGTMSGDQRLAVFLLDLSQRYQARGYSACEFILRMTRNEIGSYLGLNLETVSRLFSRFQRAGLLQVEGRTVKLLDRVALKWIVEGGA